MGETPNTGILSAPAALARVAAAAFLVYSLVMNIAGGMNLPMIMLSKAGLFLSGAVSALMLVSAATFAVSARRGGRLRAAARIFLWAGGAMVIVAIPRSINDEGKKVFKANEFQIIPANYLEGLSELSFGRVALRSKGSNALLSKSVSIDAKAAMLDGDRMFRIGLFPSTHIGPWRLTVNRFGYAPYLEWKDPKGNSVIDNWIMIGAAPRMIDDMGLIEWVPSINLMLGVGFYPPVRDDVFGQMENPHRVYVRLQEATIAGKRRDMTDPEAHAFLCDGRPENPMYLVRIFKEEKKIYDKKIKAGEKIVFPGGSIRLSSNVMLWVEIQAQKNNWLKLVMPGFMLMIISMALAALSTLIRMFNMAIPDRLKIRKSLAKYDQE